MCLCSSVRVYLIGHMCFGGYVHSPWWVALFLQCRTIILLRRKVWLIGEVFYTHIIVPRFPLNANIWCNSAEFFELRVPRLMCVTSYTHFVY